MSDFGSSSDYSAFGSVVSEPESIREWRAAFEEGIARKAAESEAQHKEILAKAASDLKEFFETYNAKVAETAEKNRGLEADFNAEQDNKNSGADWDRVCSLIDFSSKGNRNQRDTNRLKTILLQVKQASKK